MTPVTLRFRLDFGRYCAVGPGKIALLEAVGRSGSLSQAARELDMSYRRAWLLLDSLNTSFAEPVAVLSVGGKGGGGASVTPFGERLIAVYRRFESETTARAADAFAAFAAEAVQRAPGRKAVPRRAVAKRTRASSRRD